MFLFLSAELENNKDNKANTKELESHLMRSGLKFDRVEGCYKGVTENSFRVELSMKDYSLLSYLAFKLYQQDSVMVVDNENNANLHYGNGHRHSIGKLIQTDEATAKAEDAYSIINGAFYIVE